MIALPDPTIREGTMKIIALDLSLSSTGFARNYGEVRVGVLTPPKGHDRGVQRLDWIRGRVRELAQGANLAVIEGYSYGQQRGSSLMHAMGELGGVVRLALYWLEVPFVEIAPSTLKIIATGSGRGDKNAMLAAAIRRLDYAGSNDNEADALWLLEAARQHYGCSTIELPQSHLRGLASISWPRINGTGGSHALQEDQVP